MTTDHIGLARLAVEECNRILSEESPYAARAGTSGTGALMLSVTNALAHTLGRLLTGRTACHSTSTHGRCFAAVSVLVLPSGTDDHFRHGHGVSVPAGEF